MYKAGDKVLYGAELYIVAECFKGKANGEWMVRIQRNTKSGVDKEGVVPVSEVKPSKKVKNRIDNSDLLIEDIWDDFANVCCDNDHIDQDWRWWPDGTLIEDIWKWFDQYHSKGVKYLLYERGDNP